MCGYKLFLSRILCMTPHASVTAPDCCLATQSIENGLDSISLMTIRVYNIFLFTRSSRDVKAGIPCSIGAGRRGFDPSQPPTHEAVVYISRLTPVKILFRLRLQKICPWRNPTYVSKGTDHGLTPKLNIYTKI